MFLLLPQVYPSKLTLSNSETIYASLYLEPLISEVETELNQLSLAESWAELTPYLLQLPGIGLITAMTILSAIGEIDRFPTAKKLVGYAGLGARVHSSGQTHRTGGITKQGRKELRRVLIEAAWTAVRYAPYWHELLEALAYHSGREKAIVAIARQMLDRLALGQELERVPYGCVTYCLPPSTQAQ